jgi:hypothetical protein
MSYVLACEPLRVWSRLEPRARENDFSRALRAEVHDPLWMLARQWQFGEAKGEDAGSAILARLVQRSAPLDGFSNGSTAPQPFGEDLPLETRVERMPLPVDLSSRVQLGRQWLRTLDSAGAAFNAGGGVPPYVAATYRTSCLQAFPITSSEPSGSSPDDKLARAKARASPRSRASLAALTGRMVDGVALLEALPETIAWVTLPAALQALAVPGHEGLLVAALTAFRDWVGSIWSRPAGEGDTAWVSEQLEYRFGCTVPRPGGRRLRLQAQEFASGRLDWYGFDLAGEVPAAPVPPEPQSTVFTVIPSRATYPGQPNPRWWMFEDGSVDFGSMRADTTDLARILVAEFALVYGNNWFVIPCRQPMGSLAEILGIVVRDVFGRATLVRAVGRGAPESWTRWDMFSLGQARTAGASPLGSHLFVPPVVSGVQEGEPIEAVRLVRDETTNTVWGVEQRVSDGFGRGRDGHDAARRLKDAVAAELPAPAPVEHGTMKLAYRLGNSVPENWIPFLPVHKPHEDRAIRLQRASMPRFLVDQVRPVRPQTSILRPGLAPDDRQLEPFFLHEEEVPRAGVEVISTFQRARWRDGKIVVWYGRRKRTGRGEGHSGLRFDFLEHVPDDAT